MTGAVSGGLGRCGTCAHWINVEADYAYPSITAGRCAVILQREAVIAPARELDDWDAREAEEERLFGLVKAVAIDGSGYYAAIETRSDFGCVLHAALTQPTSVQTENGDQ